MENKEIDLQELAAKVLESIEAGDDYYEEYRQRFCGFVGYSVGAGRGFFESTVEDMRDYPEGYDEDWNEFFGKIDKERHSILVSRPSLATMEDLRNWTEANEGRAYDCFCVAAGIPLTNDESGPIVVIGTMGNHGEYRIFLVSNSRKEAEATWATNWI